MRVFYSYSLRKSRREKPNHKTTKKGSCTIVDRSHSNHCQYLFLRSRLIQINQQRRSSVSIPCSSRLTSGEKQTPPWTLGMLFHVTTQSIFRDETFSTNHTGLWSMMTWRKHITIYQFVFFISMFYNQHSSSSLKYQCTLNVIRVRVNELKIKRTGLRMTMIP